MSENQNPLQTGPWQSAEPSKPLADSTPPDLRQEKISRPTVWLFARNQTLLDHLQDSVSVLHTRKSSHTIAPVMSSLRKTIRPINRRRTIGL